MLSTLFHEWLPSILHQPHDFCSLLSPSICRSRIIDKTGNARSSFHSDQKDSRIQTSSLCVFCSLSTRQQDSVSVRSGVW